MNIKERFIQRKKRVRAKISGTGSVPRLSVFRSNRSIYAQVIDDSKGTTMVAVSGSELKEKLPRTQLARKVGELLAKKAIGVKITKVVLDRGGYKYHGIIKALVEGSREAGLEI
ncbi:50S ribosomal protein L18 [Candidatus Woesebacteria bacterium]|nr:50S ribosomal protein L18 [Candidatus Woesebacteria bacterium]